MPTGLEQEFCQQLAGWLGLPRAGAKRNRTRGWSRLQWTRRIEGGRATMHRPLSEEEFIRNLMTGASTALAFLDLEYDRDAWTWSYREQVQFLVLDFDLKLDDIPEAAYEEVREALWTAIEFLHRRMDLFGLRPGLTHSGAKGYHLWCIMDEQIPLGYLLGFFRDICADVPGFIRHGNRYVLWGPDNTIYAEIDSLYKTGDGALIKVPFSQHQNRRGYYEMPIDIEDLRTYVPIELPTHEDFQAAAAIMRDQWGVVPAEHVTTAFPCLDGGGMARSAGQGRTRSRVYSDSNSIRIPDDSEFLDELAEIDAWANPENPEFLPCFGYAHTMSVPPKRSRFNLRTVLVRLIVNRLEFQRGLDPDRGREVAAAYIRTRINDEEDNRHPETLAFQVNYWTANFPNIVNHCANLSIDGAPFKCCPGPCGRASPLEEAPSRGGVLDIPALSGQTLDQVLDGARRSRHHLQLFKSTRAGGTSTITANTLDAEERLAIIVPTTKIAETIETALGLAETGGNKVGALLPGNAEACLKLKQRIEQLREDFAGEEPALLRLPQLRKYPCSQCQFRQAYMPLTPGTVLQESDLDNQLCLWATIVHQLNDIDVLVLTHKKLHALKQAAESAIENPFITSIVDAERFLGWLANADVILLDEISLMIDQPDLDLEVFWQGHDEERPARDLIELVGEDLERLSRWRNDEVMGTIDEIVDGLVLEFLQAREVDGLEVYYRDMYVTESAALADLLKRVQQHALYTNTALWRLFSVLLASQEAEWVVLEQPDQDAVRNVRVFIRPKFRAGVSEVLLGSRARVIAMDATMPLAAARHLDRIMGQVFQRVNIGDPQDSAHLMRIAPWPTEIKSPRLDSFAINMEEPPERSRRLDLELLETFRLADKLWGMDNVVVAVPSKRVADHIRWLCRGRINNLDLLWHRGKESVGVENDKRIMIGLTAPYAPRGSLNWMKEVLYPDLLEDTDHDDLWRYDQHKTNYQTLSRVKDPRFDENMADHRRSVYVAWGQPPHAVEAMRQDVVCPPEALPAAQIREPGARHIAPLLAAYFWTELGIELTEGEQRVVSYLWQGRDTEETGRAARNWEVSGDRVGELAAIVDAIHSSR